MELAGTTVGGSEHRSSHGEETVIRPKEGRGERQWESARGLPWVGCYFRLWPAGRPVGLVWPGLTMTLALATDEVRPPWHVACDLTRSTEYMAMLCTSQVCNLA